MNLAALWQEITSGGVRHPGIIRMVAGGSSEGRLYAALELPGAVPLLQLRVARILANLATVQDGNGLDLRWMHFEGDPEHVYLTLTPRPGADQALFALVAQNIAEHVATTTGGEAAVRAMIGRLNEWRTFLRVRGSGLGGLALRGLFGELWFLREQLLPRTTAVSALSAWTGPGRAAQDFRFGRVRLDVKTTASVDADIEISSAEQLVISPGQRLLLAHLVLEGHADGESVPELVSGLRSAVGDDRRAESLLDERLLQMGYHSSDEHRYAEPRLRVVQSLLYEVCEGFPRLIPDMLPAGVNTVQYSIDPGHCVAFMRDPAAALTDLEAAL